MRGILPVQLLALPVFWMVQNGLNTNKGIVIIIFICIVSYMICWLLSKKGYFYIREEDTKQNEIIIRKYYNKKDVLISMWRKSNNKWEKVSLKNQRSDWNPSNR